MLRDERFASNAARMKNREALVAEMSAALKQRTTDEWVTAFELAGVPAGPVKTMTQVLEDPQVHVREMVIDVEHPRAGHVAALGCPVKFSRGNGVTSRGAPLYGEHTVEVMRELGYQQGEIDRLAAARAVHVHVDASLPPSPPAAALSV